MKNFKELIKEILNNLINKGFEILDVIYNDDYKVKGCTIIYLNKKVKKIISLSLIYNSKNKTLKISENNK